MHGVNMKSLIKRIFSIIGLNVLIGRFFNYGLTQALNEYPNLFEVVKRKHLERCNQELKKAIQNIGGGVKFNGEIFISHPLMTIIGKNVHIGNNSFFFTKGGLTIGDNTHISRNVTIYTASHNYEGKQLPYDNTHIEKSVYIAENVWIGMNVSIVPGVTIGEGAIIGMGAVITKDVKPLEIVGTNRQRVLKCREDKRYKDLNSVNSYGGVDGKSLSTAEYLNQGQNAPHKGKNLIFAVGTGRCGSMTLAEMLNQHSKIEFKHEPNGQLIKLSTDYAHGLISREEVKRRLLVMYSSCSFMLNLVYGESDQKFSNLINIINEVFPDSKFIWLIREPKQTINSMYERGWFHDKEFGLQVRQEVNVESIYAGSLYSENRLNGYKCGDCSEEEWNQMTPFERNCWYYFYWNRIIDEQLKGKTSIKIKLEEIAERTSDLIEFLELPSEKIALKKLNISHSGKSASQTWTDRMRDSYEEWESKLDALYKPKSVSF